MYNIGQKLVCIAQWTRLWDWEREDTKEEIDGPGYGQRVTYAGVYDKDPRYILLEEYPGPPEEPYFYLGRYFVPEISDTIKEELKNPKLEEIKELEVNMGEEISIGVDRWARDGVLARVLDESCEIDNPAWNTATLEVWLRMEDEVEVAVLGEISGNRPHPIWI